MSEGPPVPNGPAPSGSPIALRLFAWIVAILAATFVGFSFGSRRAANQSLSQAKSSYVFDSDKEFAVLSALGDDVFWFAPHIPKTPSRNGQIYVGEFYRSLVMHGPHKLSLETEEDFLRFIREFEERLGRHVQRTIGKLYCAHLKSYAYNNDKLDILPLGLAETSYTSGWPKQAPGGGRRHYATLEVTYGRQAGEGTVLLHASFEPSYAILNVVENTP